MKRLLRSLIDVDGNVPQDDLRSNYRHLAEMRLEWVIPEEARIFSFLRTYFAGYMEMPSLHTVQDYFDKLGDLEVQELIRDLVVQPTYTRTNFIFLAKQIAEEQSTTRALVVLGECREIMRKGLTLNKKPLKGLRDGVMHFVSQANSLLLPEGSAKIEGNIRDDGDAVRDEYIAATLDASKAWGKFTGLNEIDRVCRGAKKGELWVHAAFAGQLKTSLACNWAYNLVTRYRSNVLYVTLEMKYEQIRRMIYTLHSAHPRWGRPSLDYRQVRDGELSPEDRAFYDQVIDDFSKNPDYCQFRLWAPDEDINLSKARMHAELLHQEMDVGLIVLDHGGLLDPESHDKDYTIRLNTVLRGAKKLALQFNRNEGVPVLLLFQINRDGLDYATKNEGRYRMRDLSYANEAERSADVITTTYLDDTHRANGTTRICCLKNRDNPLFDPFEARVYFPTRRISNMDNFSGADGNGMSVEDTRNVMAAMDLM